MSKITRNFLAKNYHANVKLCDRNMDGFEYLLKRNLNDFYHQYTFARSNTGTIKVFTSKDIQFLDLTLKFPNKYCTDICHYIAIYFRQICSIEKISEHIENIENFSAKSTIKSGFSPMTRIA